MTGQEVVSNARKIVVKIGSNTLAKADGKINIDFIVRRKRGGNFAVFPFFICNFAVEFNFLILWMFRLLNLLM